MSNPALTDKVFQDAAAKEMQPGWAAPGGPGSIPPSGDPTSPWPPTPAPTDRETMRVGGVASATAVLLLLLLVSATFGWQSVTVVTGTDLVTGDTVVESTTIPPWLFLSWIVGFVLAIVTVFKPTIARITGPLYALAQGLLVGAISKLFEVQFEGIVLQAVGLTIGVFATMLVLFATRTIRVTEKLRMMIIASTMAIALVYLVSFVISLFGSSVPMIHDSGPVGIGFSLLVVGIASFNLLLDFDLVERGVAMRAPKYMEWYAAFGLMVTLVWLYLELLRLLAKLRDR